MRHAHRDTHKGHELDNGLSDKGRKQVRKIFDHFFSRFPEVEKPQLFSSPRKRCMETLEPLSRKLERKLYVNDLLLEFRGENKKETKNEFRRRIRHFIREFEKSRSSVTVICSHGDWIPVFFDEALGLDIELKKAGWAELEWDKKPKLTWLIQSL